MRAEFEVSLFLQPPANTQIERTTKRIFGECFPIVNRQSQIVNEKRAGTGVELPALKHSKTAISKERGAKCGALNDKNDSDLARLIEVWPTLPKHIKAEMMGMVEKHSKEGKSND